MIKNRKISLNRANNHIPQLNTTAQNYILSVKPTTLLLYLEIKFMTSRRPQFLLQWTIISTKLLIDKVAWRLIVAPLKIKTLVRTI
jgi:hypothetical protein